MPGKVAYRAYQLIWEALDWLYPPECGGCGKKGVRWCAECQINSQELVNSGCERCGDVTVPSGICPRCKQSKPAYDAVRSWAAFIGPVRNALHRLKYKRDIGLGERLARPMISALTRLGWSVDQVVPVPLSLARLSERGYNQSALIAYPVALGLGIPYSSTSLRKTRDTRSQVGLSWNDRQSNVAGAFMAVPGKVEGKRILIIDDVTTSGTTLNECAIALKRGGAQRVYGYTFARAVFRHDTSGETPLHVDINPLNLSAGK